MKYGIRRRIKVEAKNFIPSANENASEIENLSSHECTKLPAIDNLHIIDNENELYDNELQSTSEIIVPIIGNEKEFDKRIERRTDELCRLDNLNASCDGAVCAKNNKKLSGCKGSCWKINEFTPCTGDTNRRVNLFRPGSGDLYRRLTEEAPCSGNLYRIEKLIALKKKESEDGAVS